MAVRKLYSTVRISADRLRLLGPDRMEPEPETESLTIDQLDEIVAEEAELLTESQVAT